MNEVEWLPQKAGPKAGAARIVNEEEEK